jgi:hypothetical protein
MSLTWSDGKQRTPEKEALLLARRAAIEETIRPYQETELRRLRASQEWLRGQLDSSFPPNAMTKAVGK